MGYSVLLLTIGRAAQSVYGNAEASFILSALPGGVWGRILYVMSDSPVDAERNSRPLRWFQYRLWSLILFMCLFSCACAVYFRWAAWEVVKVIKPEGDGSVTSTNFSLDGRKGLVVSKIKKGKKTASDYTAILYERKSWRPVQKFQVKGVAAGAYCWFLLSPNGKYLISVPSSSQFEHTLWDVSSGKVIAAFEGGGVVAFSPDSRLVACHSLDSQGPGPQVHIRDTATGGLIRSIILTGTDAWLRSFSPDSKCLVIARPIQLLDIETGATRPLIKGYDAPVRAAAFSPQGERVLTVDDIGTLRVWEIASGRLLLKIVVLPHYTKASFSSDGRMILTQEPTPATSTKPEHFQVRVWEVSSGREMGTFGETPEFNVHAAHFSPAGRCILTSTFQGNCYLYDLTGKTLLFEFPGFFASFSPDGERVLTYSSDAVRIWRRRRPEWWWGHFYRAEVWAALLLGVLWLRQVYRRLRLATLRARPETPTTP